MSIRLLKKVKVKFSKNLERGSRSRGECEHKIANESESKILKKNWREAVVVGVWW